MWGVRTGEGVPGPQSSSLQLHSGCGYINSPTPWALQPQTQGLSFLEGVIIVGKAILLRAPQPSGDEMFTKGKKVKRFCLVWFLLEYVSYPPSQPRKRKSSSL